MLDWAERDAGGRIRDGCGEAVDAYLHQSVSSYEVLPLDDALACLLQAYN
jgi:hypothetical protein